MTDTVIDALKKGDENTFKKIYLDHRATFVGFGRQYGLADTVLLDIYQDAYIVFFENIRKGKLTKMTSSIGTYLIAIGKYMIFDHLRTSEKMVPSEKILSLAKEEAEDLSLDFEKETLNERQLLLKKQFQHLGKKCQELLTLFYYDGLTIDEIVASTDYSNQNVVKSQKSRCLKSLREVIKQL
ncbi:MAG: sigma-70 family RNA polymerase sigma factor [Bacteroidota bacterium]